MKLDRWGEIVAEAEINKRQVVKGIPKCPENWFLVRAAIIEMIADIDECTRVYEMENKLK